MTNVVDLFEKKSTKVLMLDKKRHAPESGSSSEKTIVSTFDDKIFTSLKNLIYFLGTVGYYIKIEKGVKTPNDLNNMVIKPPHFNCNEKTKEFREKHKGKTLNDLGIYFYKLSEFEIKNHDRKEIYWKT